MAGDEQRTPRQDAIDTIMVTCTSVLFPTTYFKGSKEKEDCVANLDNATINGWMSDYQISVAKLIGKKAKDAEKLNENMVEASLQRPTGAQGVAYCSLKDTSQCQYKPFDTDELAAARDYKGSPASPEMKEARILAMGLGWSYTSGVSLAATNPAKAKDAVKHAAVNMPDGRVMSKEDIEFLESLINDPAKAESYRKNCVEQNKDAVDSPTCTAAGIGHGLGTRRSARNP